MFNLHAIIATLCLYGLATFAAEMETEAEARAKTGDANAQWIMGYRHQTGLDAEQDYKAALEWHQKAAAQGNAKAMLALGVMAYWGHGQERDFDKAREWFKKAKAADDKEADEWLLILDREAPEKRLPLNATPGSAPRLTPPAGILKQAEAGNSVAQFELAEFFRTKATDQSHLALAFDWYRTAAESGHLRAQNNLATMHMEGVGTPKNIQRAVELYRKAAIGGLAEAQRNLGSLYYFGKGVPRDDQEAIRWIKLAAAGGDPQGIFNLGNLYYSGHGVPRDPVKAYKWQLLSTLQGNKQAGNNVFVVNLEMTPAQRIEAKNAASEVYTEWIRQGGASIQPTGFFMLGMLYSHPNPKINDLVESYKWYSMATWINDPNARPLLSKVIQQMTPEQIAEGEKLANELIRVGTID